MIIVMLKLWFIHVYYIRVYIHIYIYVYIHVCIYNILICNINNCQYIYTPADLLALSSSNALDLFLSCCLARVSRVGLLCFSLAFESLLTAFFSLRSLCSISNRVMRAWRFSYLNKNICMILSVYIYGGVVYKIESYMYNQWNYQYTST